MTHLKATPAMKNGRNKKKRRSKKMLDDTGQFTLLWWQWWLLAMVTLNTALNTLVFFKHRFKGDKK